MKKKALPHIWLRFFSFYALPCHSTLPKLRYRSVLMVLLWFFSPPFLLGDCVCKDAGSDLRVRVSLGDDGGLQFPHDIKLHHPLAELSEHGQCSGGGKAALSLLNEGGSTRTIVQDTNNGPNPMEDPLQTYLTLISVLQPLNSPWHSLCRLKHRFVPVVLPVVR